MILKNIKAKWKTVLSLVDRDWETTSMDKLYDK